MDRGGTASCRAMKVEKRKKKIVMFLVKVGPKF